VNPRNLLIALLLAPVLASAAPSESRQVIGLWQGTYSCGQGESGTDVRITGGADGAIDALVDFYPTASSRSQFPRASYRAVGAMGDGGVLKLTPKAWIVQPPRAAYSVIEVRFGADARSLTGAVVACGSQSGLALHKTSDDPTAPAQPLVATSSPADPAAQTAAASEPKGFFQRLRESTELIAQIGHDPVIVRGYVKSGPVRRDTDPLCLYNLRTKVLIKTAVFGRETRLSNGDPNFHVTDRSDLDCQQAASDGSLVVLNQIPGEAPASSPASQDPNADLALLPTTPLAMIFEKHPYDGTPATYYPKVALTVIDWSRKKCWVLRAKIWHSATKSEAVGPFGVCWGRGNFNWSLHSVEAIKPLKDQQANPNSGNVRDDGPRAPIRALPERIGVVDLNDYNDFLHTLVDATGWLPGAPTNFWLVGFKHEDGFSVQGK
jgi:hypothetical protein